MSSNHNDFTCHGYYRRISHRTHHQNHGQKSLTFQTGQKKCDGGSINVCAFDFFDQFFTPILLYTNLMKFVHSPILQVFFFLSGRVQDTNSNL